MRVGKVDLETVQKLLLERPGKQIISFRTKGREDWIEAEIEPAGQGWALTIVGHTRVVAPLVLSEPRTIGMILKQMVEDHGLRGSGRRS